MTQDLVNLFYPTGNEEALKGLSRGVNNYICIVERLQFASSSHVSAGLEPETGGLLEPWRWRPVWA